MILLEFENKIIAEALTSRIPVEGEKIDPVNMNLADFDETLYHVHNPDPSDPSKIVVSIGVKFYHQAKPLGADEFMASVYGDMIAETESGYDVSLLVDMTNLGANPAETISKVANLRRNVFAAVFKHFFTLQQSGTTDAETGILNYRDQETIYINVLKDRVTVVFSTRFTDADDVVIGKVFMQAFKDVRGKNPNAPQVLFSHKDPPAELAGTSALTGENVGYVTFVLFPRHFEAAHVDRTIDLIHTFRDYLHYHIKCSKAYLHQRMRARTADLLKILNRARPDSDAKEKKTVSGRTFKRN